VEQSGSILGLRLSDLAAAPGPVAPAESLTSNDLLFFLLDFVFDVLFDLLAAFF
jgi:hypothetical protein